MGWQRPADEEGYPRVYARLERAAGPGAADIFVVQDLRPQDEPEAMAIMLEYFLRDEPTCDNTKAIADPVFVKEAIEFWEEVFAFRTSIGCYKLEKDGTRKLVGLNACGVCCKKDPEPDVSKLQSAGWRQVLFTLVLACKTFNSFEILGVDEYLGGSGLILLPEYRGRGLAAEILRAREPLCRAVGLRATSTVFTAIPSQVVAEKCGFRTLGELPYAALAEHGYLFPGIKAPSAKVMAIKYW